MFIDVIYQPFNTQLGKLQIKMTNGLPDITTDPEVILANLSTISAVTVQGELPQNTLFGVPARSRTNVINSNIDKSKAAKAAIIQKIAQDTAGSVSATPGLTEYTEGVDITTNVNGGPLSG